MSGNGNGADTRDAAARKTVAESRAQGLSVGWTVSGYMVSGMLAYGLIGWLIGRAVHVSLLLPVGMLVGLAISRSASSSTATAYRERGRSPRPAQSAKRR